MEKQAFLQKPERLRIELHRTSEVVACMTCSDCIHYDMINCFCWVRWLEISQADSLSSCSRDDSREDDLEFF